MRVRPAKTQISLGIRPVWSESSLSAWRNLVSLTTHWAPSKDLDQPGHPLGFVMSRLIFSSRTATITDRFAVVVDTTHSSIHQISLDQAGVLNGINTASQTSITSVLYNYLTHKIILGSQDSEQVWQVNIDGTNETMLSDICKFQQIFTVKLLNIRTTKQILVIFQYVLP